MQCNVVQPTSFDTGNAVTNAIASHIRISLYVLDISIDRSDRAKKGTREK